MKRLFSVLMAVLISGAVVNAQTLDEIVKKFSAAMKMDQLSKVQTIKISGKMSAMGMEMPMTMFMKNPNKIKVVYNFGGQDMISVFDGVKGYTVNPMAGPEPVELTGAQLQQVQDNNVFSNQILGYYKKGILTLDGDDDVKGKPAFRLKANLEGASPLYLSIDKDSYMLVKNSAKVNQMGQEMTVDSFMTDYVDIKGVVMPKKTTATSGGMDMAVISFDNIEVNTPMDDSIFKLK